MYLLEGIKPLEDALDMGIKAVTVFEEEGSRLGHRLEGQRKVLLSRPLFQALSDTESSQGVIAAVEMRRYDMDGFREAVGGRNVLIMDRLQDPGNIGTIIRTAEAAGYGGIVMMAGQRRRICAQGGESSGRLTFQGACRKDREDLRCDQAG